MHFELHVFKILVHNKQHSHLKYKALLCENVDCVCMVDGNFKAERKEFFLLQTYLGTL